MLIRIFSIGIEIGENMKFKYFFALILISAILFSLGTVVASENVNASSSDNTYLSIDDAVDDVQLSAVDDLSDELENQNARHDLIKEGQSDSSSDDEVDLVVNMELGDIVKHTYGINQVSFDVPMVITANVSGGIAKNTKVYITIPDEFEYVSSNPNIGTYSSESGIWDIGDLNSGVDATLTILTKISTKGTFKISVNATTDSNDMNLSNNNLECNIQVSSKISSNTTRTTADQSGAQHTTHHGSSTGGGVDRPGDNNQHNENQNQNAYDGGSSNAGGDSGSGSGSGSGDNGGSSNAGGDSGSGTGSGSGSGSNGGSSNAGSNSGSNGVGESNSISEGASSSNSGVNGATKQINPNILDEATKPVASMVNSILNPNSDDEDSANSSSVVKAINVYDYAQIPIIIFGLFLVLLIGMVAYDKVKS